MARTSELFGAWILGVISAATLAWVYWLKQAAR